MQVSINWKPIRRQLERKLYTFEFQVTDSPFTGDWHEQEQPVLLSCNCKNPLSLKEGDIQKSLGEVQEYRH